MKQPILLFFLTVFSISLMAQDVPEVQMPLITKRAATWCPPCGGWGWTFFEHLIEDNSDKAILIAAHHSGDLATTVAQEITANFNAFSQPRFYVNNADQNVTNSSSVTKRTEIQEMVDDMSSQAPIANVGLNAWLVDGVLNVDTKTRFFQDTEGEYYVGLYIIEDGVMNTQSGQSGVVAHEYILRAAFDNSSFGEAISETSITANTDFDGLYSLELNPAWNTEKIILMSIIWKKEDDKYQFVNANRTTEFSFTNAEDELSEVTDFQVFPTVITDQAIAKINLSENVEQVQMNIIDLTGKNMVSIFNGNLTAGEHYFDIQKNQMVAGMYFLIIEINGKVASEKLIFE